MIDNDGYRKNVGIVLCNSQNKLLICKRLGEESWQFPQGGFEENENAESAMFRELFEEIGLKKNDVLILGETKSWLKYDLPKKYQRKTNNRLGSIWQEWRASYPWPKRITRASFKLLWKGNGKKNNSSCWVCTRLCF